MKTTKQYLLVAACALGVMAIPSKLTAADGAMPSCCGVAAAQPMADEATAKPDLLGTCPVSGDKLGEMGKPFTFTYKDQEVKLCCKSCKKDFDKDPKKFIKKIEKAEKSAKK